MTITMFKKGARQVVYGGSTLMTEAGEIGVPAFAADYLRSTGFAVKAGDLPDEVDIRKELEVAGVGDLVMWIHACGDHLAANGLEMTSDIDEIREVALELFDDEQGPGQNTP